MRVLVDENIPVLTVEGLRNLGHDVLDVRGTADQGVDDIDIWKIAQEQHRLLITTDKGFALRRSDLHSGILIVRLRRPNGPKIHQRIM